MLYAADALSRVPTFPYIPEEDDSLQDDVELLVDTVVSSLPASKARLATYIDGRKSDHTLMQVRQYCQDGWEVAAVIKPYWEVRGSLTVCSDILLFKDRIVVARAMQKDTIDKIHEGHQGIERCRMRANSSVWWPGLSAKIALLRKYNGTPFVVKMSSIRKSL